MIIGVVKEIKNNENRVSVVPNGVKELTSRGHKVIVQKDAGLGSGFTNENYEKAGATLVYTMKEVYNTAELIVKVKEPQPEEYDLFQKKQKLFTYLHLAVEPKLADALVAKQVASVAYESVELPNGAHPLLSPMSEIAGRMSVQIGANYLESQNGGSGILLSGVPGVNAGNILIVGAGIVGLNALKVAAGIGAKVTIADVDINKLRYIDNLYGNRVSTLISNHENLKKTCENTDLLIGAVLLPNRKAPKLITEEMVKSMKEGSVIVDVAIDQGGIVETIDKVTTHDNPIFLKHGIIHYSVANIPGAVAHTSTIALSNATLPYLIEMADKGFEMAVKSNSALKLGVNTYFGKIVKKEVGDSLKRYSARLDELI